jgi:O-antigen/teichoic acid export membrane protein
MSRTRSFFNGAVFAYLYQACAMAVGLWLTPFYIRTLGPTDYGIWLVGLQILNFLLLCDFGIIAVVPRDVARLHGQEQNDPGGDQLRLLMGQTIKVIVVQTSLIALVALGLFLLRPPSAQRLRGPIALLLFVFVITYPLRLFPAVLTGLQDLKFLGQLRIWVWALSIALAVVLLLLGARFYALACAWCLQQIGHDLIAFFRMRRIRPDLLGRESWRTAGPMHWSWFGRGFWLSMSQVAYLLIASTDLLIVGRALGAATVVIYSCTSKLITVLQNQPQTFAGMALPGLAQMKVNEGRKRIQQTMVSLTQGMLLLTGAVFCVVLAVNRQFVEFWLGPQFFGGMRLTLLVLLNFLAAQVDYTFTIAMFAFGHERFMSIRMLVNGAVSVVLASIFVRHLGMEGVPLGLLCGMLFVAIPADAYILSREFDISVFQLFRPYIPYLWRFALVGGVGVAFTLRIGKLTLWSVVIDAISVGALYLLLVFPYVWRSPLRIYIESTVTVLRKAMRSHFLRIGNDV